MIFLFHKVAEGHDEDVNWISPVKFKKFLDIHKPFVSLGEYLNNGRRGNVVTFDGVYDSVYANAGKLLFERKIPFEMFVTFNFIGEDNSFDVTQPSANFCTMAQLRGLETLGGKIQHHTWQHKDLTAISVSEILMEIERHRNFDTKYFAYPYGKFNREIREMTKRAGFRGAVSVRDGNDSKYELVRRFFK